MRCVSLPLWTFTNLQKMARSSRQNTHSYTLLTKEHVAYCSSSHQPCTVLSMLEIRDRTRLLSWSAVAVSIQCFFMRCFCKDCFIRREHQGAVYSPRKLWDKHWLGGRKYPLTVDFMWMVDIFFKNFCAVWCIWRTELCEILFYIL